MDIKKRNTLIICLCLLGIFILAAALGSGVETVQGRALVFESVRDGGVRFAVSEICKRSAIDVVMLMLIGGASHPVLSIGVTGAVAFFRGAVLGCTASFLSANSSSVMGLTAAIAYFAVTMLICGYGVVVNRNNLSRLTALCLYGAVSGCAVILRGLALLII